MKSTTLKPLKLKHVPTSTLTHIPQNKWYTSVPCTCFSFSHKAIFLQVIPKEVPDQNSASRELA